MVVVSQGEVILFLKVQKGLGLGAGICISKILDTEWGQNLLCIPYI
jgi:hypothetical protein